RETGMFGRLMNNFSKHPDVAQTTRVGDPTVADSKPTSATDVVAEATRALTTNGTGAKDSRSVSAEVVRTGEPPPNQPIPHSGDSVAPASSSDNSLAQPSENRSGAATEPADSNQNTGIQE